MYEFLDQPVERLGNGSRFILWAMRAWVNAARRGRCGRQAVAGSFVNMGAAAALPDFHATMARLRVAPGHPIAFAPLACRRMAEGEALMLSLWRGAARGDHEQVRAVLRLIVPAASADLLVESFAATADHLRQAELAPRGLADPVDTRGAG
ncbi:hypothetical protein [Sphingomonas profundi]|uniref:hypothetical protein n=1 Tax=Alterirhizorhabdus profundi TaxID=2681549 RepID=UPI0012E986B5|nr:hypothetical protein [Sphingomonas profundi]